MPPDEKPYKIIVLKGISMLLWALTAFLAGYQIFLIRRIVIIVYLNLLANLSVPITVIDRLSATGVGNIASLIMAIIAIAIVVGGFDYHWNYGGEPRSFKVLAATLAFQITIQVLYISL